MTTNTAITNSENKIPPKAPIVIIETNLGRFKVTLKPHVAPLACENFLGLIEKHYYHDVIVHRVIKHFMIQSGDPSGTGARGESIWGKTFADECDTTVKFDKPGILAMANRGPNTNGSQFFITTNPTPWLNMRNTIFGEVTEGYEVIKQIENSPVSDFDRPVKPITIIKTQLEASTQ